jgi:hypothetical protein
MMPLSGHSSLLVVEACGGNRCVSATGVTPPRATAADAIAKSGSFAGRSEKKSCTYRLGSRPGFNALLI